LKPIGGRGVAARYRLVRRRSLHQLDRLGSHRVEGFVLTLTKPAPTTSHGWQLGKFTHEALNIIDLWKVTEPHSL
jgi:hypothetical protein